MGRREGGCKGNLVAKEVRGKSGESETSPKKCVLGGNRCQVLLKG